MKTMHSTSQSGSPSPARRFRCNGWSVLLVPWCLLLASTGSFTTRASGALVCESTAEFLSSGDFNGDGTPDVLVLDKLTGNARVGYQSPGGSLTWSTALVTGVDNPSGCAVGFFLGTNRETISVTSPSFNRLNFVDVSATNSAAIQSDLAPGIGPRALAALPTPFAVAGSVPDWLFVASSFNDAPAERLHVKRFSLGATASGSESNAFERPAGWRLGTNGPSFATGLLRGPTNDTLRLWQFTNSGQLSLRGALSHLPPGSDYVFGFFNAETLPRLWSYVPGGTNVTIRSLITNGSSFTFSNALTLNFTQPVQRVYINGASNASALIQFGNGVRGVRLPGGSPVIASNYPTGGGASGQVTGIVPLGNGRFALLAAPTGTLSSVTARVLSFNGTNYTLLSSNNLPALTPRTARATVWLFQSEPFVTPNATFISSLNAPDWTATVAGLPSFINARVETDAGAANGLGNPVNNSLGTPPAGASFALPDQYRDDISLFSFTAPRPAEAVTVTVSPPPGVYSGPISVSFSTLDAAHQVFYRELDSGTWRQYTTPFQLTNDATIQYYGRLSSGVRAELKSASYDLHGTNAPPAPTFAFPDTGTNQPPDVNTNVTTTIAANGTVVYGRRSPLGSLKGFLTPSPYSRFDYSPTAAHSPFARTNGMTYFHLEDFEDGVLNTTGATSSPGWVVSAPGGDSVSPGVRSYYSNGRTILTFSFNAAALGGKLPTHVGLVWTDVGSVSSGTFGYGHVRFSASDGNGVSLGTNVAFLGDGSAVPATLEDRLFGVVNAGGISSITITMTNSGDWEVDHLQYGRLEAPGFDGTLWSINLDGSGEDYITGGLRPRVSQDGHWMSFLRENDPAPNQFSLWVRDLSTGVETRRHSSSNRYVGHGWTANNQLVFDNNCRFWRTGVTGAVTQLALPADCSQGAPSVNPRDGRLAFQIIHPGVAGLYLAPSNGTSKSRLDLPLSSPRWPAWSPEGTRLVLANDPVVSPELDAGQELYLLSLGAQTNLHQITSLAGDSAFPNGAVWTPDGNKLVTAGRIHGTNGLWIISLAADGSACHCAPRPLRISAGDDVDFAGGVAIPPAPAATNVSLGLFIRLEPARVVVYWSTNYSGFALQSAMALPGGLNWSPVVGPYFRAGPHFEYREARTATSPQKFFRLHSPAVFVVSTSVAPPVPPPLVLPHPVLRFEPSAGVLSWPSALAGFTLETATNLVPPVHWSPVSGVIVHANGAFEYHPPRPGPPQQFYRLRQP